MNLIPPIEAIVAYFKGLSPRERLEILIELGLQLSMISEKHHVDANRVRGCQSGVWIIARQRESNRLVEFACATDSVTVRGLLAIVMAIYDERTPEVIAAIDFEATIRPLELRAIISPQRMNGLFSIRDRVLLLANVGNHRP